MQYVNKRKQMIEKIHTVNGNRKKFVEYCHYFISEIIDSIVNEGVNNHGDMLTVDFDTYSHRYYYEGVALIIRTFEAKGFDIRYPKYKVCKDEDGEEYYHYTWILTKLASYNEEDDLPF